MLPARQIGSNGTDATNVPPAAHTLASSASAASGPGTCSSTSIARTRSNERSGNGSRVASPNRHGSPLGPPVVGEGLGRQVDADQRHAGEALADPGHHVPLADTDLEHPGGRQPVEHGVEGAP